ncbi:hypothetical protein LZ30DRAFT_729823 [Colletotrichum cereale]|nr:hypothetical protein LZ30DRAFT_729823 [Colletotrichum cereale]
MAFDVAAPTQRMWSTLETSIEAERIETSVYVTATTNNTSIKAITANSLSTTNNLVNDTIAATERVIGHGLVSLQQNEPQKNHALVLLEMQKPPTPEQAKRGVVYVQEHELGNGLFKIGWMDGTARDTIGNYDSCNTINADVIYETPSGPFFAASKVKNLAHIALSPYDTRAMRFQQCGPEYDGWLSAPVEMVLETVKTMEAFVQLPAYESKDGQNWELSLAADEIIRTMGDFPLERLKDTIESTDEAPAGKVAASLAAQSSHERVTCVAETAASPISLESEDGLEGTRTATTPEAMGFSKHFALKAKSLTYSTKKKAKKLSGSMASLVPWNRSQESTPER